MKHLSAEQRHLHSLLERDNLDALARRNPPRISREDTVHVRPYLNFLGIHSHTNQRSGIIGASPSKNSCNAVRCGRDEALSNHCVHPNVSGIHLLRHPLANLIHNRRRLEVDIVGDDHLLRVDEPGLNAARIHSRADDRGRKHLASGYDHGTAPLGEFPQFKYHLDEILKFVQNRVNLQ